MATHDNRRWWILGAMGAILGVVLLDETVIGVALPTIQGDLGLSALHAHWVVNVYLLMLAGLAAAAGKIGDIIGARFLLNAGLLFFGATSILAGFAESGSALIFARAAQGVAAAMIFPLSLVLVTHSFPKEERGVALGLYGTIGTCFMALGPMVGGLLTEYLSWRWIFWINPPIVLAVFAIVWAFWHEPPQTKDTRFDLVGSLFLIAGLVLLIFGIMEGPDRGWSQPDTLIPLCLGAVLLIQFVRHERRVASPLIAVELFADANFLASNLVIFTAQFVKIVMLVFGAMYFQTVMGFSPFKAGIALLPAVVPQIIIATVTGKVADKYGSRMPSLVGASGASIAMSVLAIGLALQDFILIMFGLFFWGLVVTFLFVPPRRAVLLSVPEHMHGQVSGITMTCQLMGGTIGIAACSTVYTSTGSITSVFMVSAMLAAGVFLYGLIALDRTAPATDGPEPG